MDLHRGGYCNGIIQHDLLIEYGRRLVRYAVSCITGRQVVVLFASSMLNAAYQ